MKKTIVMVLVLMMALMMASCGDKPAKSDSADSGETKQETETTAKINFEEKDGILEALDTETSPFEGGGLRTQVDTDKGTVKFIKTDDTGADTKEYFIFTPAKNEVEEYYFVSMMGTGFYYYFDLDSGEMVRLEDKDHNDSTQSAKDNGRFDEAAATMKDDVAKLQAYFSDTFGKSIEDAAAGK